MKFVLQSLNLACLESHKNTEMDVKEGHKNGNVNGGERKLLPKRWYTEQIDDI